MAAAVSARLFPNTESHGRREGAIIRQRVLLSVPGNSGLPSHRATCAPTAIDTACQVAMCAVLRVTSDGTVGVWHQDRSGSPGSGYQSQTGGLQLCSWFLSVDKTPANSPSSTRCSTLDARQRQERPFSGVMPTKTATASTARAQRLKSSGVPCARDRFQVSLDTIRSTGASSRV